MLVATGGVQALGFGRVVNVSSLGQPLNFAATVRLDGDESLTIECVSVEVIAGESRLPPGAIRVAVRPGTDPSERLIRVSTLNQIEEPIVTVNVTAGCQPQLTRSFVTLIDPPVLNFARTQPDASPAPSLPPVQPDSPVSPVVAAAQSNQPVPAAVQPAPRAEASPRPLPARTAIASVPRQVREVPPDATPRPRRPVTTPPTRAAAVRPEAGSARLRLDAATGVRPAAAKASAPPTVAAAATPATTAAAAVAPTTSSAPVPTPAASAAAILAAASAPASAAVPAPAISEASRSAWRHSRKAWSGCANPMKPRRKPWPCCSRDCRRQSPTGLRIRWCMGWRACRPSWRFWSDSCGGVSHRLAAAPSGGSPRQVPAARCQRVPRHRSDRSRKPWPVLRRSKPSLPSWTTARPAIRSTKYLPPALFRQRCPIARFRLR